MIIEVGIDVPVAPRLVWDELAVLERHVEWMTEAAEIVFHTEQRSGVGTAMSVHTRVGPFRLVDEMVIDCWEEDAAIGVDHRGIVSGAGMFTVEPMASGTRIVWREDLRFPWYLGGGLTAILARPVLRHTWRKNLDRLAGRLVDHNGP
jgi:hypothetical protein